MAIVRAREWEEEGEKEGEKQRVKVRAREFSICRNSEVKCRE